MREINDSKASVGAGNNSSIEHDGSGVVQMERARPQLRKPRLYRVVMMNDDYTPMDFVVEILQKFFRMNLEQATEVMLAVHYQGKGVCGIYTAEIAETKVAQVNEYARENLHPLLCTMEQA